MQSHIAFKWQGGVILCVGATRFVECENCRHFFLVMPMLRNDKFPGALHSAATSTVHEEAVELKALPTPKEVCFLTVSARMYMCVLCPR